MLLDLLIWWLTAQAFGLAGLPLTLFLFRALPDRGYAFGKTLGLLLAGYLAWLLAMLGLAPFGRGLVLVCAVAVAAIGLLVNRAQAPSAKPQAPSLAPQTSGAPGDALASRLAALRGWLAQHWRLVLAYEAIFALALVALAILRSYDYQILISPNPWGTERPMDYALFNAIRRSTSFPPHDPWLAGYSINYYYFGYLLMAMVSLASGVGWGAAYNLSLALVFALTALGVAGIIWNLIVLTVGDQGRKTKDQDLDRRARVGPWSLALGRLGAALLTIVLVLLAGNQGGALQVASGTHMIMALQGPDMARAVANGLGARQPLRIDPPFKGWEYEGTSVITPTDRIADFDWWPPSRAVWDSFPDPADPAAQPSRRYSITEFPFFSFWLGDMHPHVMSLPFGLLALALALQTLARPSAPAYGLSRRGWAELALTGIVLGSLYVINSWDLPTYILLFLGALLLLYVRLGAAPVGMGQAAGDEPGSPLRRVWWRHYATQAASALLAAFVLFAPFYLTFHSLVGSKEPLVGLPILATLTRTIGLVTWSRTPLQNFLAIFGLFLLPLAVYIVAQGRGEQPNTDALPSGIVSRAPALSLSPASWRHFPWVILATLLVGILIGFPLLVLLALAVYAAKLAIDHAARPAPAFALWACALVCLICFGTEVVYIRDVFESRMNTIFKFYYQAWLIWGVLAGYALWWIFTRSNVQTFKRSNVGRWSLVVFAAVFAALLAGALVYPWLTAGKALREGTFVGLDGTTPRERTPDGAAAIAWLRDNAPGDAVVLEGVGDSYDLGGQGFGQVAGSTGLATVLGWPGHEEQWRGGDPDGQAQIAPRKSDVATIYGSADPLAAGALLKKYGVDFIYVGPTERALYPPEGLAKLTQLADVAFPSGEVTIYRVK